jgi:methylated-DNA-protein-cysteine methyltransferase-like protein
VEAESTKEGKGGKMSRRRFFEKVYQLTKKIPVGKVATYGQIATQLGKPGAARAVGNALHRNPNPEEIPCYRVVNARGRLAPNFGFGKSDEQRKRLAKERIRFKDKTHVDLKKHQVKFFKR